MQRLNNTITAPGEYEGREVFFKIAPFGPEGIEADKRLHTEIAAYRYLGAVATDLFPHATTDTIRISDACDEGQTRLIVDAVENPGTVEIADMLAFIDALQERTINPGDVEGVPRFTPDDYELSNMDHLHHLRQRGSIRGISWPEETRTRTWMRKRYPRTKGFREVFVHGDTQKKHFGWKTNEDGSKSVQAFDLDMAHVGSELADYAFMIARHPQHTDQIWQHVKERFARTHEYNPLESALNYFIDYFLVKIVYDRATQPRGDIGDVIGGAYGRLALQAPIIQGIDRLASVSPKEILRISGELPAPTV